MNKNMVSWFPVEDAVWIMGDLYVLRQEALEPILQRLRDTGYSIDNLREDEENISVEEMEKGWYSLWYCHLENILHGKCKSCGQYISVAGIRSQDHQCEKCGAITYKKIKNGSDVRFRFTTTEYELFGPELTMKAYWWDVEHDDLYLYPEFGESGPSWKRLTFEQCQDYMEKNPDKWEEVELHGEKYIKVKYKNSLTVETISTIEVSEIVGHYWNHKIVKLWDGKEYGEWDSLNVPESISVYESWRWEKLEPSPTLHEKIFHATHQVSDQGWYHQDGRVAFDKNILAEMRTFIQHFTTLDVQKWDEVSPSFSLSGPGLIRDVARFCSPDPQITNKPNIGNALVYTANVLEGKSSTEEQVDAAYAYFQEEKKASNDEQFFHTLLRKWKK